MVAGLALALCAAVCMGSATVLQALGARRAMVVEPGRGGREPVGAAQERKPVKPVTPVGQVRAPAGPERARARAVVAALRGWPFLAGAGLDTLGFAAEVVALRLVPLFLVEAAVAASLAVTAVVGTAVLGLRLRRAEWGAVAVVCLGLATLAVAAGREGEGDGDARMRWTVLGVALAVVVIGWVAGGRLRRGRAVVLGAASGLSFGVTAIGVRLLPEVTFPGVAAEPTAYAVVVSGLGGYLLLVQALQSGSVTAATAAMVICETVWPGAFGVLWLGDTTRHGYGGLAVAGFVGCVAGAVALARFGEAEAEGEGQGQGV